VLAPTLTPELEKTEQVRLNVSVVGSGAVGKATGIGLSQLGHSISFHDNDSTVLEGLRREGLPVADSLAGDLAGSDIVMICVPTPTVDDRQDLRPLLDAVAQIGAGLRDADGHRVVVVRSTVLPGSTRHKVIPVLERASGKKVGIDFGVCANPEFLRASFALEDFLSSSRIVIGESDSLAGETLVRLYTRLRRPIVRCGLEEAELIKYASNAFLANKISFFNEIYKICTRLGVDDRIVSRAVSMDERIGDYGVVGGSAFGGPCLPKDLDALISFVRELGLNPGMLRETARVNEEMKSGS
jgi:UDPglucose 6-dehydrogenase